jgi:hypothetical protein
MLKFTTLIKVLVKSYVITLIAAVIMTYFYFGIDAVESHWHLIGKIAAIIALAFTLVWFEEQRSKG